MEGHDVVNVDGIGAQLSRARLHADMTIADVAALTRVSSRYLIAIEEEQFDRLPSRVHALGFTRAFAKAVNIEAGEVVEALRVKLDNGGSPLCPRISCKTEREPSASLFAATVRGVTAVLPHQFNLLFRRAVH